MSRLAFEAMVFAREAHKGQVRKYSGNPYADHLAEVAGIVSTATFAISSDPAMHQVMLATAWLHDYVEDCRGKNDPDGVGAYFSLLGEFGATVAGSVQLLSDLETGNRADRKAASRARLAAAPGWVQTIKCADLISNTSSIVLHDPKFAVTYLAEKRLLLDVLTKADPRLLEIARAQAGAAS